MADSLTPEGALMSRVRSRGNRSTEIRRSQSLWMATFGTAIQKPFVHRKTISNFGDRKSGEIERVTEK
jgi:hypothetical protein